MKAFIKTLVILIGFTVQSQIKGNQQIESRSFVVPGIKDLSIHLYANITVDTQRKEEITITTDSNLFEYMSKEVKNGRLDLNQIKWIQPSQEIQIILGAPFLERVETNTHRTLTISNISQNELRVMALVGKIKLIGSVRNLSIGSEIGTVDASELKAEDVNVNIWGHGKAIVYAKNSIDSKIKGDGILQVVNKPKFLKGDTKKAMKTNFDSGKEDISWINFKIKNNSWNRNNFFVVGPKKDGRKFSYGFPMMPGSTRKEHWTVGTKIYKVNRLGLRKLIKEITADDAGKTVKLFE